jgi:hypothetical protein
VAGTREGFEGDSTLGGAGRGADDVFGLGDDDLDLGDDDFDVPSFLR